MGRNIYPIEADIKIENYVKKPLLTKNDSVTFVVKVTDDGQPFIIDDEETPLLAGILPKKRTTALTKGVKTGDNEITFDLNPELISEVGNVVAAIKIHHADGDRTSTLPFTFEVKNDSEASYSPDNTEVPLIRLMFGDAPFVIESAQEAAANAVKAQEDLMLSVAQWDTAITNAVRETTEASQASQEEVGKAISGLEEVKEQNQVEFKPAVASVAERDSAYPEPLNGWTVRITELARVDRFNGTEWVTTDTDNPAAIDEVARKLAETGNALTKKLDKDTTELSIGQFNPNKGKIPESLIDEGLLAKIAGTAGINAVPARKSVGLDKLNWLDVINLNLHNPNTDTLGYYINGSGVVIANALYKLSDYIPVEVGRKYKNSSTMSFAFYNENKELVNGVASAANFYTVPTGVKFVRHTYLAGESGVLCEGETLIDPAAKFGDQKVSLVDNNFKDIVVKTANSGLEIADESLSVKKLDFLTTKTLNIHNPTTDTQGYYITSGGGLAASATYKVSDYIPVKAGQTYTNDTTLAGTFHDSNKVRTGMIPLTTSKTYVVPEGVAFVRHTYLASTVGVLSEGSSIEKPTATFGEMTVQVEDEAFKKAIQDASGGKATKGKTALIFADSIGQTHTVAEDGSSLTPRKTNFPTFMASELGLATFVNYGTDGASYRNRSLQPLQYIGYQVSLAIASTINPDIIIVSAGTNDSDLGGKLGTFAEAMAKTTLESLDTSFLYEAIRWSFWSLRKKYPNATFYCGLPIQRASIPPNDLMNRRQAIIEMANYYNFILIDGLNESGIVREFETAGAAGRFLSDGLHPNETGKEKLGKLYARVIRNTYVG